MNVLMKQIQMESKYVSSKMSSALASFDVFSDQLNNYPFYFAPLVPPFPLSLKIFEVFKVFKVFKVFEVFEALKAAGCKHRGDRYNRGCT